MPSALYFLKSIFVWGNHSRIIHLPRVVMIRDEKKYNPQGGVASSLALLPRVGCVALASPALSKVYPDAVGAHRVVWSYRMYNVMR